MGIPGNTSVKSLRFHFYNLSSLHSNHIHLHQLLVGKRNFKQITFSACDFGSDISLLVEGLAAQRDLQEFSIDMEDYDKKLNDEDLADIIQVISENDVGNRLRILNLYDCGMGKIAPEVECATVKLLWDHHLSSPKCLPTSVRVLPILLRAILYLLQYMHSFPSIVRLFYLKRHFHPYLFVANIQPGLDIYLWSSEPASIYN